jgi:hypothetical protein
LKYNIDFLISHVKYFLGDDYYTLLVFGTTFYTMALFWIFGGIYTFMDLTSKPSFLRKYKIQPNTNEPVNKSKIPKVSILYKNIKFKLYY